MSDNRKNIKVGEKTFETLKSEKPEGVTWDYFLMNLVEENNE